jgi:release factor glutamine methyltransferase
LDSAPTPMKFLVYGGVTVVLSPNVAEPDSASFLLAEYLDVGPSDHVADIGTGSGFLAMIAGQAAERVVATDVNPHAVECARRNAYLNGLDQSVEARLGGWYEPLDGELFDLIISNPPQMPTSSAMERQDWIGQADSGGLDGRYGVDQLIAGSTGHLRPSGRLCIVQHGFLDLDQTHNSLELHGMKVGDVFSVPASMGRLTRERLPYAATLPNSAIVSSGTDYEHRLHVICATKG